MFFLIYGEDTYRSMNAIRSASDRFRHERDPSGMNLQRFGAEDEFAVVRQAIFTSPFLAEKKMLILSGFLHAKSDVQDLFIELLASVPEYCVVVFYEQFGSLALKKSSLFPVLHDQKFTVEYSLFSAREAKSFVAEEFAKYQVKISSVLVNDLIGIIGVETWSLISEVKKIALYVKACGRDEVVLNDVQTLVLSDNIDEVKVFDFADAYVAGKNEKALRLFRGLVRDGSHPLQLSALLLKQFRVLLSLRNAMDEGNDLVEVGKSLRLHQFVMMKSQRIVQNVTFDVLREMYLQVILFDSALKSSAIDPEDALCASFASKVAKV